MDEQNYTNKDYYVDEETNVDDEEYQSGSSSDEELSGSRCREPPPDSSSSLPHHQPSTVAVPRVKEYLRSQSTSYASDLKGSGCGEDNGYCQRMGSRSMGPQSGQRFSLPRARNILDVNIDIFEQKPWKQPGADITDYFNFGFNEDTWKLYCNQVDEFRHRSSGTPASEPAQLMEIKAYGGGIEHEIVACETKQVRVASYMLRMSFREQQLERVYRKQKIVIAA